MVSAKLQMMIFAAAVGAVTVAALVYTTVAPPDALMVSRNGVPHLTPLVADPRGGPGIPVDALVNSYTGGQGRKVYY